MPHLIAAFLGLAVALVVGATTDEIIRNVYDSSNNAFKVNIVAGSAGVSPAGNNGDLQINDNDTALGAYAGDACAGGEAATAVDSAGQLTCAAVGAGTVGGSGTAGLIPVWSSSSALGDSASYRISVPNDNVTGTTTNKLVKLTSTGTAVITDAAETSGILGICVSGCGTTGDAIVALIGNATCSFTNATTAGNYAIASATVAGDCQDSGSTTFPAAGTQVLGVITATGAAGNRATFLATPDVASAASGGGGGGSKNPAGAVGDVQYRASNNAFDAEAAFNYDDTNNRYNFTNMTSATDNTDPMVEWTGTMPAVPSTTAIGKRTIITGAGTASQISIAENVQYAAGYTGSSTVVAFQAQNANAGTGTTLNLGSVTAPAVIVGVRGSTSATTAGTGVGVMAEANQAGSGTGIGAYARAFSNNADPQIGLLANAAGSAEATNLKNVAVYGTLNSSLITGVNGSFAGLFDGGTLPDATSRVIYAQGTLPSAPSSTTIGVRAAITSAGNASQVQAASVFSLIAGYTGSSATYGASLTNSAAGTGSTLNLVTGSAPVLNYGSEFVSIGAGAGVTAGGVGYAENSTTTNLGLYGKAGDAVAGNNIGVLGSAGASTEATDLKNVGVYGTLNSSLVTGVNGSFAGLFDGGTLPDANSRVLRADGTLPASPSAAASGALFNITGAGSASQEQRALVAALNGGYTGSSGTYALLFNNASAGTGTNFQMGSGTAADPAVNIGAGGFAAPASLGSGVTVGVFGAARNSSSASVGVYGKADSPVAGTMVGVLGSASNSTEGTGLKNVGGAFTLQTGLPTANVSVALLAQNTGTEDIFRGYDDTTLMFRMEDTGEFTSAGTTSIGWSVVAGADTACNTTCTSACVVGFDATAGIVDCATATADQCLCAGAS